MSGKASKGIEDKYVDVILTRSVCRIDVINKDPQYDLVSASLWNVFPRTTIWGSRFQAYEDEPPLNNYIPTTIDSGDEIKSRLYVYENYVAMPEQDDKQTTCVIVGLKKKNATKTEYYRINVSVGDLGQQLKRNNLYKININSVLGNGKSTEEDAYKDSELHISSDVNGWNVDESGIILFDGDNILALPYSQVNFTPAGGAFNCNIFTHGTGTLSITNELLPEGIRVELDGSILTITADGSEDDRQGMVEVSFGNLVATITIKQQGDKTEYLEIQPERLADFPPVPKAEGGVIQTVSDKIEVDASGPWDAVLVCNDPGTFSFDKGEGVIETELRSEDATDGGFSIYLQSANSADSPKYGFVMITLRSNPKISRVILLTQETSGGIKLSTQAVTFNPFGNNVDNTSSQSYTIDVTDKNDVPLDMALWDIKPMSSGYSNFLKEPVKSGTTLVIETKGENIATTDQQAVFRIYPDGNEANFVELTVTQEHHILQFNPSGNFGVVAAAGGRTQRVIVTSSSQWEATVTGAGNDGIYFYQEIGSAKPTTIEGDSGDEFSIVFPPAT
ncbi:MAG: hypothetical protein LIP01_10035 [Tannerellaceae bacterium]|nr:hypothetical protein [Tannerellaceae bacterium]